MCPVRGCAKQPPTKDPLVCLVVGCQPAAGVGGVLICALPRPLLQPLAPVTVPAWYCLCVPPAWLIPVVPGTPSLSRDAWMGLAELWLSWAAVTPAPKGPWPLMAASSHGFCLGVQPALPGWY